MNNDIFKNIIKNSYGFDSEKICDICGEPIGDFVDYNNIYDNLYCEECFKEAQNSRL